MTGKYFIAVKRLAKNKNYVVIYSLLYFILKISAHLFLYLEVI